LGTSRSNRQTQFVLGRPHRCDSTASSWRQATKDLLRNTAGIAPPKFVIFSSGWIEPSYRRFIERRLREEFGFPGTPVMVAIRVKERD
jgi:hypothetical protein